MDISYYYQILDTGIQYAKGRGAGKHRKIGERKRLREEALFWQQVPEFISPEKAGVSCADKLLVQMECLCKKYKLPNYKLILEKKDEWLNTPCVFERNEKEEDNICRLMQALFVGMRNELEEGRNKEKVYRILRTLHHLPKAMHGKNILNSTAKTLSYKEALQYAKGSMDEVMQAKYGEYFQE